MCCINFSYLWFSCEPEVRSQLISMQVILGHLLMVLLLRLDVLIVRNGFRHSIIGFTLVQKTKYHRSSPIVNILTARSLKSLGLTIYLAAWLYWYVCFYYSAPFGFDLELTFSEHFGAFLTCQIRCDELQAVIHVHQGMENFNSGPWPGTRVHYDNAIYVPRLTLPCSPHRSLSWMLWPCW